MKTRKLISKCCLCGKVKRKKEDAHDLGRNFDEWGFHDDELEKYYDEYDLIHSHGYCENCAKKVEKEWEEWANKNLKAI